MKIIQELNDAQVINSILDQTKLKFIQAYLFIKQEYENGHVLTPEFQSKFKSFYRLNYTGLTKK